MKSLLSHAVSRGNRRDSELGEELGIELGSELREEDGTTLGAELGTDEGAELGSELGDVLRPQKRPVDFRASTYGTFCTIVLGGTGIAFSPGSNLVVATTRRTTHLELI
jgi:hypothetical protein